MRRLFRNHNTGLQLTAPLHRPAPTRRLASLVPRYHGASQPLTDSLQAPVKLDGQKVAVVRQELWFSSSLPKGLPDETGRFGDYKPVDERKLKLGKTIRILRERLPSLLATPIPQELLSPQITLRLFPSTHPHLPSVSGRIAYTAALWTSPVAWGRVPVVGNVKLIILSERMVSTGVCSHTGEKLIVKWKTCGAGKGDVTEQIKRMMAILGRRKSGDGKLENQDFHGLFLFEFDDQGRISKHTIEHVEEGNTWERTAKVISVTDWLLGRAWGKHTPEPEIAMCRTERNGRRGS